MALKDELVRESHQKVSNVASETLEKIENLCKKLAAAAAAAAATAACSSCCSGETPCY